MVAAAAGRNHSVAILANGQLACFGYNVFGQCNVPQDLGSVVAAAAGHIPGLYQGFIKFGRLTASRAW